MSVHLTQAGKEFTMSQHEETQDADSMNDNKKVWFITGTSRGFGREWTKVALERGDRMAATARNTESLFAVGSDAVAVVTQKNADAQAEMGRWRELSASTDFTG
jgi:NAD(P)-dependent dehydrogenase (short-subunit alcohol dehydrogenase family)